MTDWRIVETKHHDVYLVHGPHHNDRYLLGNRDYTNGIHEDHVLLFAAAEKLLEACGSAVWLLNNRHNKGTAQWERYAQAAEIDLHAAITAAKD